ncbi:ferritin-like domain-containing protein [Pedobacter sp. AW31-3R]|uniref:ferritin-like domain-containing protein n=1 Tax=Pedobacter sp. AW31-3R TaxID=3445781 RepID=UPI003FA0EA03
MNIINILEEIEKVDGEVYERLSPRRAAMKQFYNIGSKVAVVAAPLAMGTMFKKAYAQTSTVAVEDVLNFALTLEYLEYYFYQTAVATSGLIPAGTPAVAALTNIRDHELAHVNLLKGAITGLGKTPVSFVAADFDYTAGGAFSTVFSDYKTLLAVAQAFEDTGVRAYKGQAGNLLATPSVLQTALQIHSVEARHASHIRQMRKAPAGGGVTALKPWITGANDSGVPAVDPVYAGEDNVTQGGVSITSLGVSLNAATESFDEPLTMAQVNAIASLFIR